MEANQLKENFFEAISKEWMIVCAGGADHYNMMTASWGGIGWLWNKPVAFVFIRPERYTFEFSMQNDFMTLSFLGNSEQARKIYQFCGSQSGRDVNKETQSGLTPMPLAEGKCVGFKESRLTLVCRKLYVNNLKPEAFTDPALVSQWYGAKGGFHQMYVVEIKEILTEE